MVRATTGIVLVGGGFVLIVWANLGFRRTGRSPKPWIPSSSLILQGPYRLSRNPMYVGMTAAQIGIGAALDNGWVVLFAIPALVVVHFIAVRPEERYLDETFGEGYAALKKRVRRYL
jgi:protein-S-isoprenylcysteine O-methyltransferase Ste14